MSEELYNIVFKGELVRTFEVAVVKKNLGQLFKMDATKVDALFSGRSIVLKRNLNFETANKYRVAIKKAGARVDLQEVKNEAPKPSPNPQGKPVFGERSPRSMEGPAPSAAPATPPLPTVEEHEAPAAAGEPESGGAFSLAPAGSDVLKPNERQVHQEANVDTSAFSLKEGGGDLLQSNEKHEFKELDVDLSAFDLAEVGADVLNENERKKVEAADVDVSQISIAEPGVTLGSPKPPPPPAPDVSNIHLADE